MSDLNFQLCISRIVSPYSDIRQNAIRECAENSEYLAKPEVRAALTIASYDPQSAEIANQTLQKINSQITA